MRLDIFNIDIISRFIQEQISQSFSFFMSLNVHDNINIIIIIIISRRCTHYRICNQTSLAVCHSILPLYSMTIFNQPHRLMSFRF